MIKHLFKLMWNKKKENFLLISEILVSFMVTFAVFSLLIYNYQNYKLPTGFKYENVWMVSLFNAVQPKDKDSITAAHDQLKMALLNLPKVKEVSYISGNAPFTHNTFGDNITYHHFSVDIDTYTADRDYEKLMGIKILSGRWFNAEDKASAYLPIVLNASTAERMNLTGKAVGEIVKLNGHQKKVIGVIQDLKDKGTFTKVSPGIYSLIDTSNVDYMNTILVKVDPDADARFEDKMYRLIANATRSGNIQIQHLSEMQSTKDKDILVPLIVFRLVDMQQFFCCYDSYIMGYFVEHVILLVLFQMNSLVSLLFYVLEN